MDSTCSLSGLTNANFTLFDSQEEESKVEEFLSKYFNPKSTSFSRKIESISRLSKKTQVIDGLIQRKHDASQICNWTLGMSGVLTGLTAAFGVAAGPAILATLVAAGLARKLHNSAEDILFSFRKSYKIENVKYNPVLLHNTHVSFIEDFRDKILAHYSKEIARFNIITVCKESFSNKSHISSLTKDVLGLIFSVYVKLIASMSEEESNEYFQKMAKKLYKGNIENIPTSSYAIQLEKQIWSDFKALSML